MSEFNKVVAWDKDGPIEVEMYVVVRGKKVVIQGDATIEGMENPADVTKVTPPSHTFAGMQWTT